MTIFDAIIIGVVEGLTEFLPISSTGHMIVVSTFLGLPQDDFLKSFEVVIQVAAIAAVAIYYRGILFRSMRIWLLVGIGALPVLVIGYLLSDIVKQLFSVYIVAISFIVGGVFFLLVEHFLRDRIDVSGRDSVPADLLKHLSVQQVLCIGFAQILALIPGMSRSGMTIIGGLLSGLSRRDAAMFSFLLAIPVMLVVTVYDFWQTPDLLSAQHYSLVAAGFLTAFVVAYGSLHVLMRFLERHSFIVFGWYRIVFGVILLMIFV